jgi:predicted dehydrogenase
VRVGLLSTARINARLVAGAREAHGVEVVAVGSRDRARAREHADALGIPRAHGSYEALLADPDVDVIYNSLPNSMHVPWSIRALDAGKHVLCEKPLARRAAEAAALFDAAAVTGLVVAEAFMWRHHPQTRALMEQLPSLGELRLIRAHFSFNLDRPGDIRFSSELEGGALMDVGCYCVSAARLIAGGEPEAVAAQLVMRDGVDVRMTGQLRFSGDVLAHFDCAMDSAHRHELEVVGSEGSVVLADPWHPPAPDPYACMLEDFAAAVSGAGSHPYGRADAVGQARTIERLYAASSPSS